MFTMRPHHRPYHPARGNGHAMSLALPRPAAPARPEHRAPWVEAAVPERTGPLDLLRERRVLVIADVQNLTASAEQLECKFSYRALAALLRKTARSCTCHAFFGASGQDQRRSDYFRERGWTPYPYEIHFVGTCRGLERRSNVDTLLACTAGALISRSRAEVVVLCSGDGQLVHDVAQAIARFPKPRLVITTSIAGSTAHSLNAQTNPYIAENIECGMDVLHLNPRRR